MTRTLKVRDPGGGGDGRGVVATFLCDGEAFCCAFAGERMIVAGDRSGRVHFLSLELQEGAANHQANQFSVPGD